MNQNPVLTDVAPIIALNLSYRLTDELTAYSHGDHPKERKSKCLKIVERIKEMLN